MRTVLPRYPRNSKDTWDATSPVIARLLGSELPEAEVVHDQYLTSEQERERTDLQTRKLSLRGQRYALLNAHAKADALHG